MTEGSIFVCLLLSATLPLAACSDDSGPAWPADGTAVAIEHRQSVPVELVVR